jgi:hypothetical protein
MPLRQMLATLGSAEVAIWIAEFQLRAKEEQKEADRAREEAERNQGRVGR